eukprot:scaffold7403_cov277-Pinguiococcus_pyrenoidosus.AAC.8
MMRSDVTPAPQHHWSLAMNTSDMPAVHHQPAGALLPGNSPNTFIPCHEAPYRVDSAGASLIFAAPTQDADQVLLGLHNFKTPLRCLEIANV